MPGPPFCRGDVVSLHPIEEDDLAFIQRNRNDPAIRAEMATSDPQNAYEAQQAHEQYSGDDSGVGLLVVPSDCDDPVGQIVLFGVDETHGNGELACWITPNAQGNGYAKAATELMLDHAFGERRLHKVVARPLVHDEPSRATLESVSFLEEGIQRHEKYVDGEYHDVVRYSVLRSEWGDG